MAIESVLTENRVFHPSEAFKAQAHVSGLDAYNALCAEAEADYEGFGRNSRANYWYGINHLPRHLTSQKHHFTSGLKMVN